MFRLARRAIFLVIVVVVLEEKGVQGDFLGVKPLDEELERALRDIIESVFLCLTFNKAIIEGAAESFMEACNFFVDEEVLLFALLANDESDHGIRSTK